MERIIASWKTSSLIVALAVALAFGSAGLASAQVFGGAVDQIEEDVDAMLAADRVCNGGSCLTVNGTTLNCPTSGGPTCQRGEACTCRCIRLRNGTYTAANHCGSVPEGALVVGQ